MGNYQEAITHLRETLVHNAEFFPARFILVAAYMAMGRMEEARAEVAHVQGQGSDTSLDIWSRRLPYKDPNQLDSMIAALKQAGFK